MTDNRGFTLIELIFTIAIMLIITIIIVPSSIKFISYGKQTKYEMLEDQLISAADKYYIKNKSTSCIPIDDLKDDIDDQYKNSSNNIVDPRNNTILTGYMKVITNENKVTYEYKSVCS